jgi:hypothetical protein
LRRLRSLNSGRAISIAECFRNYEAIRKEPQMIADVRDTGGT